MWRKLILLAFLLTALSVVITQPAAAQVNTTWNGSYYNNPGLQNGVALSRNDPAIAFNWGAGAPGPNVNADNFSVRWGTDVFLNAGTYRFSALADDAVRVIVDFQINPLIDTWPAPQVGQVITRDITLDAGVHHVQVDYREFTGDAYVFVSFVNVNTSPSGPSFPPPQNNPISSGPWTAQYFGNRDLSGSPTLIQTESAINYNWGGGSPAASIPADNFSARWTSLQNLPAGNYQVRAFVDDGIRVFVDGVSIINEWRTASGTAYTATINLSQGQHSFLVEYFEAGGVAFIEFSITRLNPPAVTPSIPNVPPPSNPTGLTATVTASRLNVRNQPNPFTGSIVAIISRGDTYPVLSSNVGNTWFQINANGVVGWVNSSYVRLNQPSAPPPTAIPQVPGSTGYVVTARPFAVNIRPLPDINNNPIAVLPLNQSAPVVGRNTFNTWWQINYQGVVGWVSSQYARIQDNADLSRIPVTG